MAENIYTVEKTLKTPYIHFDASTGKFQIEGNSVPEHSVNFYAPLNVWLDDYVQHPAPKTYVKIQLNYFNTTSSKCILELLKKLDIIFDNEEGEVIIDWIYEEDDEDTKEVGEDYQSIINSTINLVPINNPE